MSDLFGLFFLFLSVFNVPRRKGHINKETQDQFPPIKHQQDTLPPQNLWPRSTTCPYRSVIKTKTNKTFQMLPQPVAVATLAEEMKYPQVTLVFRSTVIWLGKFSRKRFSPFPSPSEAHHRTRT